MTKTAGHRRRTPRRLGALVLLVALAALSATGTVDLLRRSSHVAVGGPVAMEGGPVETPRAQSPTPLPDAPPPSAPAPPAVVSIPVGPHVNVPILYYHYIRTVAPTPQNLVGFNLSITPQLFNEQMALLHVEGAHTITLATLLAAMQGRMTLPSHPVVLTFDDGYTDFATVAVPILERYRFVATDFVVSGFVGHFHYMTAAQVRAVEAAGMVIGAHTVHHVNLAAMSPAAAWAEVKTSQADLQALLGQAVLDFAYPYGAFNAATVQLVQQAGFRDAVSTMAGTTQLLSDRFLLHRTELGGSPTITTFAGDAGLGAPSTTELALILRLAGATPSPMSG